MKVSDSGKPTRYLNRLSMRLKRSIEYKRKQEMQIRN